MLQLLYQESVGHGSALQWVMQSRTSNNSPTFTRKEPWTATYFDNLKLFSVQLACAGGSSAIAKTAVAPLERVKASSACFALP